MTSYLTDCWKNIWSIKFKLASVWLRLYQRELPIKESFYKNNYPNMHQNWNSWMSKKLKIYIATSAGRQVVEPRWKMQVLFLVTSFVCCCYCSLFTFILFFFLFFGFWLKNYDLIRDIAETRIKWWSKNVKIMADFLHCYLKAMILNVTHLASLMAIKTYTKSKINNSWPHQFNKNQYSNAFQIIKIY